MVVAVLLEKMVEDDANEDDEDEGMMSEEANLELTVDLGKANADTEAHKVACDVSTAFFAGAAPTAAHGDEGLQLAVGAAAILQENAAHTRAEVGRLRTEVAAISKQLSMIID